MIINVRGTSGSGNSTLMRSVMDQYTVRQPVHVPGRKRPAASFRKVVSARLAKSHLPRASPTRVAKHPLASTVGCDDAIEPQPIGVLAGLQGLDRAR